MKLLRNLLPLGIIAILAACASMPPAVGDWNFEFDTPQGPGTALVTVANDGTGLFSSGLLGDVPLSNLAIDGNSVAFTLENTLAGVPVHFSGTIEGDAIAGEFDTPIGALPVAATRAE